MIHQTKMLQDGQTLSQEDMFLVVSQFIVGRIPEDMILMFLNAFGERLPTVDEIVGAVKAMRETMTPLKAPYGTVDCCGTGGDQSGTYNISTAVALVAAGAGVPVAKHGNRAASSKSGAADVLEALGVKLDIPVEALEQSLKELNFAFLMATKHHKGMRFVAEARKKYGKKTIFNVLGPLANPAGAKRQLIGVYSRDLIVPMIESLKLLGARRAMVVHGADGLDEITLTGTTYAAVLDEENQIKEKELTPESFELPTYNAGQFKGGSAEDNAVALRAVLEGQKGPYRDIVLANAAAALMLHGSASSLSEGVKKAAYSIDKGEAGRTLRDYIAFTRSQ